MKISGILANYAPYVLQRVLDLVDPDLIDQVVNQAIEKMEQIVLDSENKIDDTCVLPVLKMMKLILDEEKDEQI